MHANVCGGQRLMSSVFPNCAPSYVLRHGLSLSRQLFNWARLPSQRTAGIHVCQPYHPSAGITNMFFCAQLLHGSELIFMVVCAKQFKYSLRYFFELIRSVF